jgi:hypothetical protein
MIHFLHWYYVEWIMSGTSWTALGYLGSKTLGLLIVLLIALKVITFILKPFVTGFKREMKKESIKK